MTDRRDAGGLADSVLQILRLHFPGTGAAHRNLPHRDGSGAYFS